VIPAEFIMRLSKPAMESQRKSGVLASITIAQAALESGWGESGLARTGNNLFGIKADSRWRGETITLNTREFIRDQWIVVPAKWRKYANWQASIDDHAAFLKRNPRYKACFSCATAPADYANKLIALMSKHQLESLDGAVP
jgi:flagellum-specific peptidoglycan hydrolase FlgJ